jgi:hypothetical protein
MSKNEHFDFGVIGHMIFWLHHRLYSGATQPRLTLCSDAFSLLFRGRLGRSEICSAKVYSSSSTIAIYYRVPF